MGPLASSNEDVAGQIKSADCHAVSMFVSRASYHSGSQSILIDVEDVTSESFNGETTNNLHGTDVQKSSTSLVLKRFGVNGKQNCQSVINTVCMMF
jgi:hypothetical protein